MLMQSESQLAGMYGGSAAATIINNCDTYVYMGGMDLETCKNASLRMNAPLSDIISMPVGRVYVCRRGMKPAVTERYPLRKRLKPELENPA